MSTNVSVTKFLTGNATEDQVNSLQIVSNKDLQKWVSEYGKEWVQKTSNGRIL